MSPLIILRLSLYVMLTDLSPLDIIDMIIDHCQLKFKNADNHLNDVKVRNSI